ncbi:MAG: 30S ribosome-binding factor RbfA [Lactobacillales bacterium]|jgi:ribosome-binding factor A|nr:30S ribosome-binding factor RbfA [Lactobacillales bacterium]
MAKFRDRRLAQEIQHELSDILRNRVKDPRVQLINVTDVRVTQGLEKATIYYSVLSELASDNKAAAEGVKKATPIVRKELSQRLKIYKVPEIIFEVDESVRYGSHIDKLLAELNSKKD